MKRNKDTVATDRLISGLDGHLAGLKEQGLAIPGYLAAQALVLASRGLWDAYILDAHPAARFCVRDLIAHFDLHELGPDAPIESGLRSDTYDLRPIRVDLDLLKGYKTPSRYGVIEDVGGWAVLDWSGFRPVSKGLCSRQRALEVVAEFELEDQKPVATQQTSDDGEEKPIETTELFPSWKVIAPGRLLAEVDPTIRVAGQGMHVGAIQVCERLDGVLVPTNPDLAEQVSALYTLFSDDMETTEIQGLEGRWLLYAHPYAI